MPNVMAAVEIPPKPITGFYKVYPKPSLWVLYG